ASLLRQLVAGPRLRHPESNLDLCYVTDEIIATSGPSSTYPRRAYRNPTDALVRFLDTKHGANWSIWEFRAEGTGYPDEEVYGRIHHFPFPDHHPPPFALVPLVMAGMRNWLGENCKGGKGGQRNGAEGEGEGEGEKLDNNTTADGKRVAVVHCKAGKGRSGTMACSFLISERGWAAEEALRQFTERRMRVGFGRGVSIPSQLRWVGYVDRWTRELGKTYVEKPVEVLEVHVWGLRDGVEVDIEGFVEEGRRIKCFHRFESCERVDAGENGGRKEGREEKAEGNEKGAAGAAGIGNSANKEQDTLVKSNSISALPTTAPNLLATPSTTSSTMSSIPAPPFQPLTPPKPISKMVTSILFSDTADADTAIPAVTLRPRTRVIIPTSDVNISIDRRAMSGYTGWTVVTSVAHVWFNAYFEGGNKYDSGVFEADWDALDGIKGTWNKGVKALDRIKVVWRYADEGGAEVPEGQVPARGKVIREPGPGEPVPEGHAADWSGREQQGEGQIDPHASSEELLRKSFSSRRGELGLSEGVLGVGGSNTGAGDVDSTDAGDVVRGDIDTHDKPK
ncbi:hypothetical protein AJ79_10272, partial [Helicocarpus griseus UAMH5409]